MKLSKKGKKILLLASFLLFSIILIIIVTSLFTNNTDGAKFKRSYESYNNKKVDDTHKYQKLKIKKKNKVKNVTIEEAIDILENKTGLIYFGFPNCPYCRGILPILLDTVEKSNLTELYYLDMTNLRDEYKVEDGRAIQSKSADASYYELLSLLNNYLDDYIVTDENGIEYEAGEKRLYVPLVVGVQEGFIVEAHNGSVELDENQSPFDPLTKSQIGELEVVFQNIIDKINVN